MKTKRFLPVHALLAAACLVLTTDTSQAGTIVLNTIPEGIMVGQNDSGGATLPSAPGDGWFTGSYAGTVRQRTTANTERRTQWYFKFDTSALSGLSAKNILDATLSIPQIGRINGNTETGSSLRLFDNNFAWDLGGTAYPGWNDGRESPTGSGTLLHNWGNGAYQANGTTADTSNPDVEGTFDTSSAALLSTVQSWTSGPSNNEGFLLSLVAASNSGLAFDTPTLTITVAAPEPSSLLLAMLGVIGLRLGRGRRRRR